MFDAYEQEMLERVGALDEFEGESGEDLPADESPAMEERYLAAMRKNNALIVEAVFGSESAKIFAEMFQKYNSYSEGKAK